MRLSARRRISSVSVLPTACPKGYRRPSGPGYDDGDQVRAGTLDEEFAGPIGEVLDDADAAGDPELALKAIDRVVRICESRRRCSGWTRQPERTSPGTAAVFK